MENLIPKAQGQSESFTEAISLRFSLRTKLFLLVLVPFVALIVAIIVQIRAQANFVANNTVADSLSQSYVILKSRLQAQFSALHNQSASLALDARILPSVISRESASLQDLTYELQETISFDILIITDQNGTILSRSDDTQAIGEQVNRSRLFSSALREGQRAEGFMVSQKKLYLIVVGPIMDNVAPSLVRGAIAIAVELKEALGNDIKALSKSEVMAFISLPTQEETAPPALDTIFDTSSYYSQHIIDFLTDEAESFSAILNRTPELQQTISLNEEDVTAMFYTLRTADGLPVGLIASLRSRSELLRPFEYIRNTTLLVGTASILLACLLSVFVARQFGDPILNLVRVAKDIQQGEYPVEEEDPTPRSDEIGVLTRAMSNMARGLKEKGELESYLAVVADQVEESYFDHGTILSAGGLSAGGHTDVSSETIEDHRQIKLGELFDNRYLVQKWLGSGGFSTVYLAEDKDLGESLALKTLDYDAYSKDKLEALRREIRLARKITHRNILRIFDMGLTNSCAYISMEYVHGCTLDQLVEKCGPLKPRMGLLMAKQLCWAVAAAHREGVLHRDIKPQNMIIDRRGVLKIMDFGIAQNINQVVEEPDAELLESSKSRKNILLAAGTPHYMSPEQFTSGEVDFRSDIYSTGIVMFFLFSGLLPFQGQTPWQLMYQHLENPPPLLGSVSLGANKTIEQIVDKALKKDPSDRFQTMQEMAEALENIGY